MMIGGKSLDNEVIFVQEHLGDPFPQSGKLPWKGKLRQRRIQLDADDLFQRSGPENMQRLWAILQTKTVQHPNQSEIMIPVQVADKHMPDFAPLDLIFTQP
jgi:hypothetical protein